MAKQNDTGVYQKINGYWEYRFRQKVNGKMVTHKKTTDAQGNKLKTKKEAVAAREEALVAARASSIDGVVLVIDLDVSHNAFLFLSGVLPLSFFV